MQVSEQSIETIADEIIRALGPKAALEIAGGHLIDLPYNWTPRDDQRRLWDYLMSGGKRAVEVAHRRWGKDDVALHYTATAAYERVGTYWHMLPQYSQARKVVWDAVNPRTGKVRIDEAFPQEIRARTRVQDMFIKFKNGSTWQLVGSDNYDSIVGSPPIGIVFSEWALADPMTWGYLAPILEENDGWALFIYTSRGSNHGKTLYESALSMEGWFAERLPATQTPVFTSEQLDNIKIEYINIFGPDLGNSLYCQEYYCDFAGAVLGAFYASVIAEARAQNRVTRVPYQVGVEVDTFWDLGVDDSMTIWFMQPLGQSYNWIDYEEGTGYGMEYYAQILKNKGYVYGNHYMPHDARRREMSSGVIARSVKDVAQDLGIKPVMVVDRPRSMDVIIQQHIPACRRAIASSWFDEDKCKTGLAALENYRAEYDTKKKVLGTHPVHDWSSHASDAFRTFVSGYKSMSGRLGKVIDLRTRRPGEKINWVTL